MQMELLLEADYFSPQSTSSLGQKSDAAHDSPGGKTSQELIAATRGATLQAWLSTWQDSTTLQSPRTAGQVKAARLAIMACSNGHVWMRNGSDWRSGAVACSLSSILETGPIDPRYFLSATACAGILRRAEKRGKALPIQLHRALQAVAEGSSGGGILEDRIQSSQSIVSPMDKGGAELGIDRSPTLTCNHESPIAVYAVALRGREGGATAELGGEVAGTQRAGGGGGDKAHVLVPIAFSCKDNGRDATPDLSPTLRSMNHSGSHANGGGQMAVCITGKVTHTLKADGFDGSEDGTGRGQPIVNYGWQVRRLTPRECERLMGQKDDYTLVPVKKAKRRSKQFQYTEIGGQLWQLAADGPRYKLLGNSMAISCMAWIGKRIQIAKDSK